MIRTARFDDVATPARRRATPLAAAAIAALLAACAGATTPKPRPPEPAPATAVATIPAGRFDVRPLPADTQFSLAVARGTRTREGVPGPRYWQQRVAYTIDASLDPETGRLDGVEDVVYHNASPDTLGTLVFHLYQNLFRQGVPRDRFVPITGGVELDGVSVGPDRARPQLQVRGTLMTVRLPKPVLPGDSTVLHLAWHFTVPPEGAPRMGHIDHQVYNLGQWYPQIATYDDIDGWHTWPYLGDGEFYLEYGDFDVSITVPEGWVVGATGTLRNADEVLTPTERERLARALAQDDVVHVVTEDMLGEDATQRAPGGQLTWRFQASDVRDFALATSNRYLWDATRVIGPDSDDPGSAPDTIAIHSLYVPEADAWKRDAEYLRHAIGFHAANWHPYPWPQMTGAYGPVGGMEYPMMTFIAGFTDPRTLYDVTAHELAHMWFPMMVGSNEPSYPWMDEGFATYLENWAMADFWKDDEAWADSRRSAENALRIPSHTPIMRHADLHGATGTRGAASYTQPGSLLRSLEQVLGRETFRQALRDYADTWIYKHPQPRDFFNAVEKAAGRDLDWFWYPWFYAGDGMDQAIADVRLADGGRTATVTVHDLGEAPMPIVLGFTLDNGETVERSEPVDVWLDTGTRTWSGTYTLPAAVDSVKLDPEGMFLDVDHSNDVWPR